MKKDNVARAEVLAAIARRQFPPVIRYPEQHDGAPISSWFHPPTITWAPECLTVSRKPVCVVKGCPCEPKVKQYMQRTVEDVDHKTVMYFARYKCSGLSNRTFSTIDDEYIASSKVLLLRFPYLLTHKSGISSALFDIVYDSMLTTKGVSGAVNNITRRREKRYYQLISLAGVTAEAARNEDASYSPILPPQIEPYMAKNACIDAETLMSMWLTQTQVCSRLCEAQMAATECKRVIRLDHSQKFCSKLKIHGSDNSKTQSASIRLLLLVQNEVGQIMGRALTRSENHRETQAVLEGMKSKMEIEPDGPLVCVCDNANTNRNLIHNIFGAAVEIKQDPFHVIQRLTEKIKDPAKKKWLAGQLSRAIYDVERNLRTPSEMEKKIKCAVDSVAVTSLSVSATDWEKCVASNLAQIRRGDLFVSENQYFDEGGAIRVVSTSQLEAIHSKLRKLLDRVVSIEVGLRVLDIFILQHNLSIGAKHKRNPPFDGLDFMAVVRAALLSKYHLPDMPQTEYIFNLLQKNASWGISRDMYRPGADPALGRAWERLYDMISLDAPRAEAQLLHQRPPTDDIRTLLASVRSRSKHLSGATFACLLGLEPEYDSTVEFSSQEYALLLELRAEQLASNRSWSQCGVVATVMYNTAVHQLDNPRLDIKKRGYRSISKRLDGIDERAGRRKPCPDAAKMITTTVKPINDDDLTPDEEALIKQVFAMVRDTPSLKKRKQVYATVYDFASCVCDTISPKSRSFLLRWWDRLKRAQNRSTTKKNIREDEAPTVSSAENFQQPASSTTTTASTQNVIAATEDICSGLSESNPLQFVNCISIPEIPDKNDCQRVATATAPPNVLPSNTAANPDPSVTAASAPSESQQNAVESVLPALYQLQVMDADTMAYLRAVAGAIPKRTRKKWAFLHAEYMRRHPTSTLTENGLRCRLREKRTKACRKLLPVAESAVAETESVHAESDPLSSAAESNKRPAPACESCRSRKRKCGPNSLNAQCANRKAQPQNPISAFFNKA